MEKEKETRICSERRGEGKKEGKEKEDKKERKGRVIFWNVVRLRYKDRDFWKGIRQWDVMIFIETWIDEKNWRKIKGMLPKGYIWVK